MKRHGNLYESMCSKELIYKAIRKASKGKRNRNDVKRVLESPDKYVDKIHNWLIAETFEPSEYQLKELSATKNRKHRLIYKPNFYPDQIIHWCVYLAIRQYLYNGIYVFSCGSVPGRGIHYGKKYVEKWLRSDRKNTKYYLKMDVRKFYPSIDTGILLNKLERKFKDNKLLKLIAKILDKAPGLPIGMLLSQVFANFYLQDFDYYVKQILGAKYYVRYMDDLVIFGPNKKELHAMVPKVAAKLAEDGLTLKGNWQVSRTDKEMLDFMGFRFDHNKTILRRSIMLRLTRKVRRVAKKGRLATFKDASAIVSYLGWLKHSDSHGLYMIWVRPYLKIQYLKHLIRRHQNEETARAKYKAPSRMGP